MSSFLSFSSRRVGEAANCERFDVLMEMLSEYRLEYGVPRTMLSRKHTPQKIFGLWTSTNRSIDNDDSSKWSWLTIVPVFYSSGPIVLIYINKFVSECQTEKLARRIQRGEFTRALVKRAVLEYKPLCKYATQRSSALIGTAGGNLVEKAASSRKLRRSEYEVHTRFSRKKFLCEEKISGL